MVGLACRTEHWVRATQEVQPASEAGVDGGWSCEDTRRQGIAALHVVFHGFLEGPERSGPESDESFVFLLVARDTFAYSFKKFSWLFWLADVDHVSGKVEVPMRKMHKLNTVAHFLSSTLFVVMLFGLGGCEGDTDEDAAGVDAYFEANPYSSEAREDPGSPDLEVEPDVATISIIGETVVFTGKGGEGPYTWSVSDPDYGHVDVDDWSQAIYTCDKVGNNDVIVQDKNGCSAAAHITPVEDTMTISPSTVDLVGSAYYAAFAVSGGTPPYVWSAGNVSMGTVSYSADTSHLAGYTAVPGAYGVNVVTVTDAEGRTASVTVTQSAEEE